MCKRERWCVAGGVVVVAGLAVLAGGVQRLGAQPKPTKDAGPVVYQYVGVQQTIARVDLRTGRIEILSKRGEPNASMLMPDTRPWEWREVPLKETRSEDNRGGKPADHGDTPKPGERGETPTSGEPDDERG